MLNVEMLVHHVVNAKYYKSVRLNTTTHLTQHKTVTFNTTNGNFKDPEKETLQVFKPNQQARIILIRICCGTGERVKLFWRAMIFCRCCIT